jgi:hypothetical protein
MALAWLGQMLWAKQDYDALRKEQASERVKDLDWWRRNIESRITPADEVDEQEPAWTWW